MHLLVVAMSFPSPDNPYPGSFIGQQVKALADRIERITVVSPVPRVPPLMSWMRRIAAKSTFPDRYEMVDGRCEVLYPRYLKAPGNMLLSWTATQWCRLLNQMIAHFAETDPISIIHAHTGSVSSWAALHAARRYNIPCVVTYHGSEVHTMFARRQKGWKLCRDSFATADVNLPVSRLLMNILSGSVKSAGRCETMLLGVDRTRFYPSPTLSPKPQVLYVGRIEEAKGAYDLLRAWEHVLVCCPDARLTMVGEDRTSGSFLQEARSLGIADSITLTGPMPGNEVAGLMRHSQIFCLPSHNEGTPVSMMEALSCGLPIVATRVGGIPDIVNHAETGLLVDKGDVTGLASALQTLLHDHAACVRMGKNAQDFAAACLDIRRTANRLVALYQETISVHRSAKTTRVTVAAGSSTSSCSISNSKGAR